MKTKTVIATAAGVVAGAAAGVAVCATEWGQKNVLLPVMAGKEYLKNKLKLAKDEIEEAEQVVETVETAEHVETD